MTIIVKSISQKYGGRGGTYYNDLSDIITEFGGSSMNITSIDIRRVEIYPGRVIDSIQFTYHVVMDNGTSNF